MHLRNFHKERFLDRHHKLPYCGNEWKSFCSFNSLFVY